MNQKITPKALEAIRKKYNLPPNSSLSASQFRELQEAGAKGSGKRKIWNFAFKYDIEMRDKSTILVTLTGRHLSKNDYDPLPLFDTKNKSSKHHYKKAIKDASETYRLVNGFFLKKLKKEGIIPIQSATVHYTFYNRVSRDHDNGSETIKRFQDTFTALGIIVDDSRKHLISDGNPDEVLINKNEEYKVVAKIKVV